MDIHDFVTFLEVSRTRHFGQAARNLCITQSTVSARIRQLEQQLGTALFIRERNNIQLTPAGEKMLSYAEVITTAWKRARQEVGLSQAGRLPFGLGATVSLGDILLQAWLQQLHQQHAELALHAETHSSDILIRRVLNGSLDLAVVFDAPQNDSLVVRNVTTINLLMVADRPLGFAEAMAQDYILVDWGTSFLIRHAQQFPDQATPALHIGQGRIALEFILNCGGSAYLAQPMVQSYLDNGHLHAVEGAPLIERTAYALYNSQNEKAALIDQLLNEMLTETWQHAGNLP